MFQSKSLPSAEVVKNEDENKSMRICLFLKGAEKLGKKNREKYALRKIFLYFPSIEIHLLSE